MVKNLNYAITRANGILGKHDVDFCGGLGSKSSRMIFNNQLPIEFTWARNNRSLLQTAGKENNYLRERELGEIYFQKISNSNG